MALILVMRLFQYNPDMTLHAGNWRRVLLIAFMIAQKTWDDRALRNKDFPQIWTAVTGWDERESPIILEEINEMERAFLRKLDHQMFIAPSTYASTYFELCSLMPSDAEIRRQLHRMIELAGATS
ncbi:hypothetical protein NGA_0233900 [Nannochloropsis gaditana CCMP526]|uniref:uncharacterized protein n=1 Tax=Nannochloropsis gaditana (strain CCMP526) TaxID=1093141 RepID=UPI00029F6093|nr:hypothetical protein NGA_0233900 [Nannochloropsis gaditana CCMP526]EKU21895.1 hypothetical protein NGA_0233900 [Nannochloropsis gaditana CCMP526]|eukprot:XP_005854462.1 hypothetical protein NGA_0233900 [Nannochloropsis gaditana CCMP526]